MATPNAADGIEIPYATGPRRGRRVAPTILLSVGVYLLVGCIPVPSTQQYMTNGKRVPSHLIGKSKSAPVRLGQTTFAEAADALAQHLAGTVTEDRILSIQSRTLLPDDARRQFFSLNNRRAWAVPFERRTGFLVWPLCGAAETFSHWEYLVLEVDERGVITDYHTVKTEQGLEKYGPIDPVPAASRTSLEPTPPATKP